MLKKLQAMTKGKSGQAIVEYMLIMVITVFGIAVTLAVIQGDIGRGVATQAAQIESRAF